MPQLRRSILNALVFSLLMTMSAAAQATPAGLPDPALLDAAYGNDESFRFDVSWSGGIRIGELHLRIT